MPMAISCSSAWASSISVSVIMRFSFSIFSCASRTVTSRDFTSFL